MWIRVREKQVEAVQAESWKTTKCGGRQAKPIKRGLLLGSSVVQCDRDDDRSRDQVSALSPVGWRERSATLILANL